MARKIASWCLPFEVLSLQLLVVYYGVHNCITSILTTHPPSQICIQVFGHHFARFVGCHGNNCRLQCCARDRDDRWPARPICVRCDRGDAHGGGRHCYTCSLPRRTPGRVTQRVPALARPVQEYIERDTSVGTRGRTWSSGSSRTKTLPTARLLSTVPASRGPSLYNVAAARGAHPPSRPDLSIGTLRSTA